MFTDMMIKFRRSEEAVVVRDEFYLFHFGIDAINSIELQIGLDKFLNWGISSYHLLNFSPHQE